MSFQDQWSRLHDKPTDGIKPSSNNGWIYTAYFVKAGGQVDRQKLGECFNLCRVDEYTLLRSPEKTSPPISRDEILGLVALGLLKPKSGTRAGWIFSPYEIPKFSLVKLVKQLWFMRPEFEIEFNKEAKFYFNWWLSFRHRNFFWQNNLDQLYRFAFRVPFNDRHFILKNWDKFQWYNPVHLFYATYGKATSKLSPNGLDWLKYGGKVAEKEMVKEFPVEHPIRQKLGL